MKCIAVDDEPIALSIISEYCRRLGGIELETYTSPIEAMEAIKSRPPDVVFLDIEMNSHNGLELAKEIPDSVCVIFTTAYGHYALDGFEADAVDFLHKPFFYNRFEQAIRKAKRFIMSPTVADADDMLTLKVEHSNVIVRMSEIIYLEAMDNYVKVFRHDAPTIVTQLTMKEMESRLPRDRFIRVHRSYIVRISEIEKYSNRRISLHGTSQIIPVGRTYSEAFKSLRDLKL